MRCPSCNKFPSFEAECPDDADLNIEETQVTGSVRLVLNSECCSEECKEYTFDIDLDVSGEITDAVKAALKEAGQEVPESGFELNLEELTDIEVETDSCDPEDRFEDKDRHGKKIKSMRFMKHMYGVHVPITITGTYAGVEFKCSAKWFDEVASSEMEELN